jgi:hypothetical protein
MAGARASRGVLDTSTVIRLGEISDPGALPAEPVITAVTLAELSVGPLVANDDAERAARQAHLNRLKPTSIHFRSTQPPRARSAKSPPRCAGQAVSPWLARTTR